MPPSRGLHALTRPFLLCHIRWSETENFPFSDANQNGTFSFSFLLFAIYIFKKYSPLCILIDYGTFSVYICRNKLFIESVCVFPLKNRPLHPFDSGFLWPLKRKRKIFTIFDLFPAIFVSFLSFSFHFCRCSRRVDHRR